MTYHISQYFSCYNFSKQRSAHGPELCVCALCLQVDEGYKNISRQGNNITLDVILSEWHKLCNDTMNLPVVLEGMVNVVAHYWMSGSNNTSNMTETLLERSHFNNITVKYW